MTTTFADLGVSKPLVDALAKKGIIEPFPVQIATIPDAIAGRDVCGRAPTGSGKTIAFGLPLLARVGKAQPKRPRALVLAPTRELAEQIRTELIPLAATVGRKVVAVYGGASYHPQRQKLRQGADILVACPGRLMDLIQQGDVRLDDVDFVVIDEADRMADMGFLPQVRELLDMTSSKRQTLLFSATLDGDIAILTSRYQNDPVRHEVGRAPTDTGESRHFFWRVESGDRLTHTADVVSTTGQTIIFTRTRHGADRLAKQLDREGVKAAAIHGGRSQSQRSRALALFQGGKVEALVATDVAARGIHVDDVACVVHFDPPADVKDYLHRSGRTARAGASGAVVSFIGRQQVGVARRMQRDLGLRDSLAEPLTSDIGQGGGETIGEVRPNEGGSQRGQGRPGGGGNRRNGSQRSGQGARSAGRTGGGAGGRNRTTRSRHGGGAGGGGGATSGARRSGSNDRRASGDGSRSR